MIQKKKLLVQECWM